MKTLYFEGAGMSDADISKATVGNCRIRSAFHLDNGKPVYLEISGSERQRRSNPEIFRWRYTGFITDCHYITDDLPNDDCNNHRIVFPGERESGGWVNARTFAYTEAEILRVVNGLGASFDAIKVLPDLGGYQVFREKYSDYGTMRYNYGDLFQFDQELLTRREAVYRYYYEMEKLEREFPNFSLWVVEDDPGALHLLRHFPGTNTHWLIRVDKGDTLEDWMATATELPLGKYGC